MYVYITQGRPDRGLLRLTPRAQGIITQGIGVYAAPLLQPTQITARTAQGNPIYVYHPTAIARLPIPSDTDVIYFTDASGTQQRTPTVGCASVRITRHAYGLHVEHHTGATISGASSHGELRTMADAVIATPPPTTIRPRNIWVVVDATVDIHLAHANCTPCFSPKHLDFVTEKYSFFAILKILFFKPSQKTHFSSVLPIFCCFLGGSNNHFLVQNQRVYRSFSSKKDFVG